MEIKDYITKNLTNLNWNILPQIFEENDVELTEEIEAYLRNTPENTNWNVFYNLITGEETTNILIDTTASFEQDPDGDWRYYYAFINYTWDCIPSKITLTFDDATYENIQIFITDGPNIISGAGAAEDGLFTFDFGYTKSSGSGALRIGTQQTGATHHVIVYDISKK